MGRSIENVSLAPLEHQSFMPVLSIQQAVERFNTVVEFVRTVMREGIDYGRIPGTDKPTLLKPGAEKLCTLFGLACRFELVRSVEDWDGSQHEGEPFFYYLYRCQLWRGDGILSEGDGSCNSFEQKYRYREAQRRCPSCGLAAIIKGKEEYGGGWLCFKKKGGCGMKFADEDAEITSQPVGRVPNENIADQVNTIQKMAQKRALIAATLLAVNGSEFFTQDGEDRIINLTSVESRQEGNQPSASTGSEPLIPSSEPDQRGDDAFEERARLVNECAHYSRLLKSAGHPDFAGKASIIRHLQKTAESKTWDEGTRVKSFSDLSVRSLKDYITVLEQELKSCLQADS
jgi:hypothetical protein